MRRSADPCDRSDPLVGRALARTHRPLPYATRRRIGHLSQDKLHSCNLISEISAGHKMGSVMLRRSVHVVGGHELRSA